MSLVPWYAGLAVAQGALALWLLVAQPRKLANQAAAALLLLWAGSGVVFQLMREAADPAAYVAYNRIGSFYEAPTFLLVLLIVDALFLARPRPVWRTALLGAAAVGLVLAWAAIATGSTLDELAPSPRGPDAPLLGWASLAPSLVQVANIGSEALALVLAARVAADPARGPLQRRQAALVGVAFGLLLAPPVGAGAVTVLGALAGQESSLLRQGPVLLSSMAIMAAAAPLAYALPRLPRPLQGLARPAAAGLLLAGLAVGVLSGTLVGSVFGFYGTRVVWVTGFALVLAAAILRYDVADHGPKGRRRVETASGWVLGLAAASVAAGAMLSLAGDTPPALGLALVAGLAPLALLAAPLRSAPARLTQRLLLPPRDPEALRERVRVYATTLRAAMGPDDGVAPEAAPALAALRAQLGLSQRDHDLLLALGPTAQQGVVAYRLALEASSGDPGSPELQRLRAALGVTDKEHALLWEEVRGQPALSEGALLLGRYRVIRPLGRGGFGEVWLARDGQLGREVVVKRLVGAQRDARALRRAQRELRAAGAIQHPNIVTVHDVATVGADTYLVMEHCAGGSLADVLRARGRLPEAEAARIGLDLLEALQALHARGIVHRDVKPGNILLDAEGRAKLGDFTVAREVVSGDTVGADGHRGPVGTFAYMPPEQARGLAARAPADLYGLAASLHEAVAGAPPLRVEGLSHEEAIGRIVAEPVALPVAHASPAMSALLAWGLAKAPEERFPDAAAMAEALRALQGPRPPAPGRTARAARTRPPRSGAAAPSEGRS